MLQTAALIASLMCSGLQVEIEEHVRETHGQVIVTYSASVGGVTTPRTIDAGEWPGLRDAMREQVVRAWIEVSREEHGKDCV